MCLDHQSVLVNEQILRWNVEKLLDAEKHF